MDNIWITSNSKLHHIPYKYPRNPRIMYIFKFSVFIFLWVTKTGHVESIVSSSNCSQMWRYLVDFPASIKMDIETYIENDEILESQDLIAWLKMTPTTLWFFSTEIAIFRPEKPWMDSWVSKKSKKLPHEASGLPCGSEAQTNKLSLWVCQ